MLGRCEHLDIVGFKANAIVHAPAEAIPANLRWLILGDNRIAVPPETLGDCHRLQKLTLAGNRLSTLPDGLAGCDRLELIRLSANRFATLGDFGAASFLPEDDAPRREALVRIDRRALAILVDEPARLSSCA